MFGVRRAENPDLSVDLMLSGVVVYEKGVYLKRLAPNFFPKWVYSFGSDHACHPKEKRKDMFDIDFLKAAGERALKTFAQTLVALVGTDASGIVNVDLSASLSVAATAAGLSLLTSFASANAGPSAGPSLVGETTKPQTVVVEKIVEKIVEVAAAPKKKAAKK